MQCASCIDVPTEVYAAEFNRFSLFPLILSAVVSSIYSNVWILEYREPHLNLYAHMFYVQLIS